MPAVSGYALVVVTNVVGRDEEESSCLLRSKYRKRLLGAAGVSPNSEEGAVAVQFRSALVSTTTKAAATMATFVSSRFSLVKQRITLVGWVSLHF